MQIQVVGPADMTGPAGTFHTTAISYDATYEIENRFTGDPLVIDCNGSKVNVDDLLMFSMIELGNDYGHWDTEMNGPLHRLHLHVQD